MVKCKVIDIALLAQKDLQMITIYKNSTTKQGAMQIVQLLKRVDKSNLSVMHTVIVPDRASLEMERLILEQVGGSFNVQVLTFKRLASRILPKYDYLSKQAGIMALAGIIQDNKPLKCYTKGADSAGFVADMYDTISMMKYCKISPEQLVNKDFPKSIQAKCADIALLYRAYMDYTKDKFIDSADKLDLLCEQLPHEESIKNGYFYICDFDNLSTQELALVEQLMLTSRGVTISCCVGKNFADKYLFLDDIYNGVLKVCQRNQMQPNIVENTFVDPNAVTRQIGEHLYHYTTPNAVDCGDFVQIFQGETRYSEVYNLACHIQNYVRHGGRFKDVYVVTSDVNKYTNAISNVFDQLEIPYFCDKQFALADQPYAQFVLDYLNLYRNNGRLQNVLSFVKNYLFSGDFDGQTDEADVYKFENYCLKYNISYRYDNFSLGLDDFYYPRANVFREKFNQLYKSVVIPQGAKAVEYVAIIRTLLESQNVANKNTILSQRQMQGGNSTQANVTSQSVEKLEQVLLLAETIMGNRFVTLEEFTKALTAAISSVKISVIPQHNDCVVFANMAKARKHDIKFLALLGANYGAMPIVKKDCKLLTDANIDTLEAFLQPKADLSGEQPHNKYTEIVGPKIFTENKRERFSLYQLLQEPTEKLYISYTTTDGVDSLAPSPFVEQLCTLFTVGNNPLAVCDVESEEIFTQKQAVAKVVLNKRKLADQQMVKMPSFEVLSKVYATQTDKYQFNKQGQHISVQRGDKLFFKSSRTSVSQLTQFFNCPYKFFIKYGLNVNPREIAQLKSNDLGTILHDVMEHYVAMVDVAESRDDTIQKANDCFDKAMSSDFYRALKTDPKMQGVLLQLRAEAVKMCQVVKEQLANSKFKNLKTELSFDGDQAPMVNVNYGPGEFNLNGKIDRVDGYGDYIIIIDYKSGAGASDYTEKSLYDGQKLQLLVYLQAAKDFYQKRPAGFYYFNMHNKFTDGATESTYTYKGRTLSDIAIASAIDTKIASRPEGESFKSEKLGFTITKKGAISAQNKNHITAKQFDDQLTYTTELIKRAGQLMHTGYIAITPYEGCCSYCDYKCICDFGDVYTYEPRKVDGKIDASTISAIVAKNAPKGEDDE